MKKKIITFIICLLCAITLFSGCGLGSYVTNNKDKGPQGTVTPGGHTKPEDPDNPPVDPDNPPAERNDYTATVYYNNTIFNPGNHTVTVVWRNSETIKRAELGSNGKAQVEDIEGDFNVYLEGLPSNYSYDPSAYVATETERDVTILITDVKQIKVGTGEGLYRDDGCYIVNYDGTYRAEVKAENIYVYYEYTPTEPGWYKIESWVNAYEDEVDPFLQRYIGSSSYKNPGEMYEDGGFALEGGFTKNFYYEVKVDKSEVGNSFTFAISAVSKFSNYPVYVDFVIAYLGEYSSSYSDVRMITAQRARGTAKDPAAGEHFEWADMGTKVFDMDNYKFNPNTGHYHRYSLELYGNNPLGFGAGFGPRLYCAIKKALPSYNLIPSLYDAHSVPTERGPVNFLLRYNVWLEDEKKFVTYNYEKFIRNSSSPLGYGATCNKDGCCYVTEELKEFLQAFAEGNQLWTDGVELRAGAMGTPEANKYIAKQDALWLFACGFYTK